MKEVSPNKVIAINATIHFLAMAILILNYDLIDFMQKEKFIHHVACSCSLRKFAALETSHLKHAQKVLLSKIQCEIIAQQVNLKRFRVSVNNIEEIIMEYL